MKSPNLNEQIKSHYEQKTLSEDRLLLLGNYRSRRRSLRGYWILGLAACLVAALLIGIQGWNQAEELPTENTGIAVAEEVVHDYLNTNFVVNAGLICQDVHGASVSPIEGKIATFVKDVPLKSGNAKRYVLAPSTQNEVLYCLPVKDSSPPANFAVKGCHIQTWDDAEQRYLLVSGHSPSPANKEDGNSINRKEIK